eukprot:5822210-Ditylum_brightwellii.AAC.1
MDWTKCWQYLSSFLEVSGGDANCSFLSYAGHVILLTCANEILLVIFIEYFDTKVINPKCKGGLSSVVFPDAIC